MKVSNKELLEALTKNLKSLEDPSQYLNISDLAQRYEMRSQSMGERLKRLKKKGLVKLSKVRSDLKKSTILNKSKIYIPTSQGLEKYGIPRPESGFSSVGPKDTKLELKNIHRLEISFKVLSLPSRDRIDWDNKEDPIELNNGVKQFIKRDENEDGERITMILYKGKNNSTLVIKPKLLARGTEGVEELKEEIDRIAHEYRRSLERRGYRLGLGQKNDNGTKYTLRSPVLEDLGYLEAGNFTIDRSEGVEEIHPKTGSEKGNRVVAQALDGSTLEELKEMDPIEILEETGQVGELFTEIEKNRKIQLKAIKGVKEIAKQQGQLAQSFNDLLEEIKGVDQRGPEIDRGEPGRSMYG